MRIAFITVYPPRRDGIGDYAAKLVRALRRVGPADVAVDIYSLARDGAGSSDQRAILSMNPRSWAQLRRELRVGNYDVVHLQFDLSTYLLLIGPIFLILASLRTRGGPRIVATYHDAYADRSLYGQVGVIFYKVFSRVFDRIYVHTRPAESCVVEEYNVPAAKVRRIDHGTYEFANAERNDELLRQHWNLGDGPVVLSFGFIYRTKGIEVLIDAAAELAAEGHAFQVVIAGEPAVRRGIFKIFQVRNQRYLDELKEQVSQAGLDARVTFVGHVPNDKVFGLFKLAEVVVLPYLVVDQSGVLNIAISAHTPVIASDIGGIGETLAETGIVVPPGSSTALARALGEFLTSPDLRERLGIAYGQLAQHLSTDTVAGAMLDDYRTLCRPLSTRVVQVSAYYPPHLGGQESVVQQLAGALARDGARVKVVSSKLPRRSDQHDEIPVCRLWAREVAHTPLMPGLPFALLRRGRGAVFHLHTGQAFVPETVGLVCRLLRRPYVCHVHLLVRPSGRMGRLLPPYQKLVLGAVLRRAAAVICLTESMRHEVIRSYGMSDDRAVVIPNGVGEDWFIDAQRVAQPGEILFVGRLTSQKNLGVVIRAMAELSDAHLTVIGDGEERTELESLTQSFGLANVTFLGRLEPPEVRAAMLRASLLVLPSTHEGMPLVVLEAAAAGLPVVASDIPELRDTGLVARLVPPHDPVAWAVVLRHLVHNISALEEMSVETVRRARDFRWDHLVTQWRDLYDHVLAEASARRHPRRQPWT
jgi:glycosyltransferase involved in cell wall biosynthesis